ncbi:MAG: four helix bundle protein [Bacteroidia bacterium]|nr:four helix bundle protein [Bacteroidia bacterium]
MATIKSFEEILAWQKARILANKIYILINDGSFKTDFKLRDQINSASGSVMDNIAEGFERDGKREFIQFLSIAKGSAGEVRSQLCRAVDRHHISEVVFNELTEEAIVISKLISKFMSYLNESNFKGTKYVSEPDEKYQTNISKNDSEI